MTRAEKIARYWHQEGRLRKPHNRRLLVKVQLSVYAGERVQQVLIYNQDKSTRWMGNASRATMRFMAGASRRFAYAHLTKDRKISLDGYAPEQDW